jgi:hypothetical protein
MIASFDHTISRDRIDHSYKMRWWANNGTRVYSYAGSQEELIRKMREARWKTGANFREWSGDNGETWNQY